MATGHSEGLALCLRCHSTCEIVKSRCNYCGAKIHLRKPLSLQRTWALTILAAILYIPANVLPIMTVQQFGQGSPDTIISGIVKLVRADMVFVAALVFIFSVVVPIFKIMGLTMLLLKAKLKGSNVKPYLKLYRFLEGIGRWSMLDIFIIALLVSLVRFGYLGQVEVRQGAVAFASVVVVTMLATMHFDPRILWDQK